MEGEGQDGKHKKGGEREMEQTTFRCWNEEAGPRELSPPCLFCLKWSGKAQ